MYIFLLSRELRAVNEIINNLKVMVMVMMMVMMIVMMMMMTII
jgi:hypothetical protein